VTESDGSELFGPGFLQDVAARTTAPGGGAVSGLAAALAAALAAMSARFAEGELGDLAGRADELRGSALALAGADRAAYAGYVQARRAGRDQGELVRALDQAIRVPLEIAAVAAEVAALALRLVEAGNPRLRGDAATAVLLAAAAARSSSVLVCENLTDAPGDPRLGVAGEAVAAASLAERALLARYPALGPTLRP
jgi:methenyltetrahydrofolate cyclohydrolase